MAVGAGIGASLGIGIETAYGTYAAPTSWTEFDKESLALEAKDVDGQGIAAGRLVEAGSQRVRTSRQAKGAVDTSVFQTGMGTWLAALMGSTAAPVQQATSTAYLQTHTLGNPNGISRTIQMGIPDLEGAVHPYTFLGCKITDGKFTCGLDELLKASFTIDAMDVTETETLVTPAFVTPNPEFHFAEGVVLMGAYGSEAAVAGIRKAEIDIKWTLEENRFYFGGAGLKQEPVVNGWAAISGTLDTDLLDKTKTVDLYNANTPTSLLLTFTGPIISGTYAYEFTIHIPQIWFTGKPPEVGGPGVVQPAMSFVGRSDETNAPMTLTYQSTDTTL